MKRREKILASLFLVALLAKFLGGGFWDLLFDPVNSRQRTLAALQKTYDGRQQDFDVALAKLRVLGQWKQQSLSPDPQEAMLQYQQWLTDLGEHVVKFPRVKVSPGLAKDSKDKSFVELRVTIAGTGTLEHLSRFIEYFSEADLLHRLLTIQITSPSSRGNPILNFTLVAEGVSLKTAVDRGTTLFPRTALAAEVDAAATTIQVKQPGAFPTDVPFRVRVGAEFVTVNSVAGDRWTITRAADGSPVSAHAAGELVELAPLELGSEQLEQLTKRIVSVQPFAKPAPPKVYQPSLKVEGSPRLVRGEAESLQLKLAAVEIDPVYAAPQYRLTSPPPEGLVLNADSGELVWTPAKERPAGSIEVEVAATFAGTPPLELKEKVTLTLAEPNHAPTVAEIENQAASPGRSLQLTVSASDPDPETQLTYSLADGGPPGAVIDAQSGAFSWTPPADAVLQDYPVTVQVRDSGDPPQTASRSFTISLREDLRQFTYLVGSISDDEKQEAWLYDRLNSQRIVLRKGEPLKYGDISAMVESIGENFVLLAFDDAVWRLNLGDNLLSLKEVAADSADK